MAFAGLTQAETTPFVEKGRSIASDWFWWSTRPFRNRGSATLEPPWISRSSRFKSRVG